MDGLSTCAPILTKEKMTGIRTLGLMGHNTPVYAALEAYRLASGTARVSLH